MILRDRIAGAGLALVATLFAQTAFAQTPPCKFRAGAFAWTDVEDSSGTRYRYRLSSRSDDWRIDSLGYHVSAVVSGPGAAGVFGIGDSNLRKDEPYVEIDRKAFTFYERPYERSVEKEPPKRVELAEGFKGWLSRVAAFKGDGSFSHDIVNIVAGDGCASFFVRLQAKPDASVDGLLSALTVSKSTQHESDPFKKE